MKHIFKKSCLLIILLFAVTAHAQLIPGTGKAEEAAAETPRDSLGRRSPRGTVEGFITAIGESDYVRASHYLELNKRAYRKEAERIRIVTIFQRLLDQSGDIQAYGFISNKETGRTDEEKLAEGTDLVGNITAAGETIDLLVKNTAKAGDPAVWLFSAETVEDVLAINVDTDLLIDKILPDVLKEQRLGGVPVGHWLALVVLIMLSYLAAWAVTSIITLVINFVWKKAREEKTDLVIRAFELPFRLYLTVWIFVSVSQQVGISIIVRQRFSVISVTVGIVAILMLLWRIADLVSIYTKNRMTARKRISTISVIMFLRRTAKVAIVVFGIIAVLGALGVDVTAAVAALGIGGIALALGAQKTMENFVGSVTLIADQPIRVGDFCRIGDISGTVESIGMRSTKLRTAARTIVTIPNGDFSSDKIENLAFRDRFLFNPSFYFRMETTPDQMRYLLVELRAVLYAHPKVLDTPPVVRFTGITSSSLKVDVISYVEAPNWDTAQEIHEDLLLRMMDVVISSGTYFAMPTQMAYTPNDLYDFDKANAASETVQNWRDKGEMQLPKFDPAQVEKLKGTIKYPPEGSVVKEEQPEAPHSANRKLK
ncbi:mechanosensitive ion channel family protein [Flavobacterium sp. MFBS3-15]|uniref:mechanosensitive ion channel family protein n=1 Tax=Flavobacterium sp. MFBS3-15 TaxID=2989816 RepID=UPI002236A289|nr:mechanosensitive ion channel family protein [Flavobacterium sp. MFBS3-15]MCW4468787.1 mechanosensitive ion channel family protein [Flavobacterium sp. MFBS3-15]